MWALLFHRRSLGCALDWRLPLILAVVFLVGNEACATSEQVRRVAGLALGKGKSVDWCG